MNQRPVHKTRYMDLIKEKIENNLKLIGIGDDFYPEVKVKWKVRNMDLLERGK